MNRNLKQWQRYRVLELIPEPPASTDRSNSQASSSRVSVSGKPPSSWWQAFWQMLDLAFWRDLEPRLWQSTDPCTGQTRWHLYNPETGKTIQLSSEAEIRQWLEQVLHH